MLKDCDVQGLFWSGPIINRCNGVPALKSVLRAPTHEQAQQPQSWFKTQGALVTWTPQIGPGWMRALGAQCTLCSEGSMGAGGPVDPTAANPTVGEFTRRSARRTQLKRADGRRFYDWTYEAGRPTADQTP